MNMWEGGPASHPVPRFPMSRAILVCEDRARNVAADARTVLPPLSRSAERHGDNHEAGAKRTPNSAPT